MTVNIMNEFGMGESGDINTYPSIIKLNTLTGVWSKRNVNESGESVWTPFTFPSEVAMDMANFKKGYNLLRKGMAPDNHLVLWSEPMPKQPSDDHKPCFEVNLLFKDKQLGFVTFSSNSICVINKMQALLEMYQNRKEDSLEVPVCAMQMETVATANGEFQVPKFTISKYVNRPEKLIKIERKEPEPTPTPTKPEFDDNLDDVFGNGGEDEF